MARQLKNLVIEEVSSVDRGAGRGVRVMLMKREFSQDERDKLADSGAAMPDGSFPIKTRADLSNAIQAIGRAKDRAKAMAHIKARAKALGAEDALPESWSKRDDDGATIIDWNEVRKAFGRGPDLDKLVEGLRTEVSKIDGDAAITDKKSAIQKALDRFNDEVGKLSADEQERITTVTPEQIAKMVSEAVTKGVTEATKPLTEKIGKLEFERDFATLSADKQAFCKAMSEEDKKKFMAKKPGEQDEEMAEAKKRAIGLAGDPIVKALQDENAEIKKRLAIADEKEAIATFAKRATDLGLPEAHGEVMRKAYGGDKDAIAKHEQMLKGLAEAVKLGKVFSEFGDNRGSAGGSAYDELMAKAAELQKSDPKLTKEQAFTKVYEDPANLEIKKRHIAEENTRIAKAGTLAA